MKAKGHWVWLVAKEKKLGVNDSGVNDGLGVKAVPRAAAVYDRQLKNDHSFIHSFHLTSSLIPDNLNRKLTVCTT